MARKKTPPGYLWDKTDAQIARMPAEARRRAQRKPDMEVIYDASKPGQRTVRPRRNDMPGYHGYGKRRMGNYTTPGDNMARSNRTSVSMKSRNKHANGVTAPRSKHYSPKYE